MKGGAYTIASTPQIMYSIISERVSSFLKLGNIQEEEPQRPAEPDAGSPYTDLTQSLGDRLTEYELVEDLIERGTLGENADGTLFIRLQ